MPEVKSITYAAPGERINLNAGRDVLCTLKEEPPWITGNLNVIRWINRNPDWRIMKVTVDDHDRQERTFYICRTDYVLREIKEAGLLGRSHYSAEDITGEIHTVTAEHNGFRIIVTQSYDKANTPQHAGMDKEKGLVPSEAEIIHISTGNSRGKAYIGDLTLWSEANGENTLREWCETYMKE